MSIELPSVPVRVPARTGSGNVIAVIVSVLLAAAAVLSIGLLPAVLPILYIAAVTPSLVDSDLRDRRLPNRLVLPGYLVCAAGLALDWIVSGQFSLGALVSGLACFVFFLLLSLAGGMGMGDVKLAGVLGLSAGLVGIPAAIAWPVLAFVLGGLWSVALLIRGRRGRIPFGPFLMAGYWLAVVMLPLN